MRFVFAALVAAVAFPGAARADCFLENVASPQEIAGGWTIHEDRRIVKQVDSAPYEQGGAGNWFVDRETTTLPMCSVFDDLGGYSLRSYMLQPIVTKSQFKICQATGKRDSVPFAPADATPRPADTTHEVYSTVQPPLLRTVSAPARHQPVSSRRTAPLNRTRGTTLRLAPFS